MLIRVLYAELIPQNEFGLEDPDDHSSGRDDELWTEDERDCPPMVSVSNSRYFVIPVCEIGMLLCYILCCSPRGKQQVWLDG